MLSEQEQRALEAIDGAAMLARVERWCAINSGSTNLSGLAAMAAQLADAFGALPGQIARHAPAPVESVAADGSRVSAQAGDHLLVSVRPDAARRILLTGHMDTVYSADHPFQSLRWTAPGVLNGPGVADMKGGIAVMLAALQAIEAAGVDADFGYDVLINSDEEVGSASSAPLIAHSARGKLAALTFEPAMTPDGTLAAARPGSGNFSFEIRGRAAHAGRNPEDGRNALVAAADLAVRLKAGVRDGLSINPARIDGGSPNNVVPDLAILRVNLRPRGPEELEAAERLIAGALADVAVLHEVMIYRHGGWGRPPKPVTPEAERLFALVEGAGADLGLSIERRDSGGVCDGNNIAACAVPVIDTMGVRGGAIHSEEEYLISDSLVERAGLAAVTMLRLAERGLGDV